MSKTILELAQAISGAGEAEQELLEQELVTYFIGGRNEHISFYAARDLFE